MNCNFKNIKKYFIHLFIQMRLGVLPYRRQTTPSCFMHICQFRLSVICLDGPMETNKFV